MGVVEGHGVERGELDAVWDSLVGDRGDDDAMSRWAHLSSRLALLNAVASRIGVERAKLAAQWHADGDSFEAIARRVGLSRSRAQQLVERGRARLAAEWHADGDSFEAIARPLGLSRSRAQQLVEEERAEGGVR